MAETDKNKPKTQSGTAAGTGAKKGQIDLAALVAAAAGMGGTNQEGPAFTTQDAAAYVQSIYQQILGRNAVGAERTKAISIFLNQGEDTDATARAAAVEAMVQDSPEFIKRQENSYLDAIYNEVLREVGGAQA
jgi:hypothetical protein